MHNNPIIANGGVKEENMPKIISRDKITLTEGQSVKLVQIQKTDSEGNISGTTEQIYAYGTSSSSGSTEQDGNNNNNVTSTLGKLAIDESGEAGEKAYDEAQKTAKENEVVNEAKEEERLEDFAENNYWIGLASEEFAGGKGTPSNPYQISNAEQLSKLAFLMNSSSRWSEVYDKHFKLTNDIDLSEKCWIPIGAFARKAKSERYFCGTFDGNGKTITGLNSSGLSMEYVGTMMNDTTPVNGSEFVYGLFGGVNGATIKDFTLKNVSICVGTGDKEENGNRYLADSVGAVVAYHHSGNLTLEKITVTSGSSIQGYDDVGGIIGRSNDPANLTLNKCNNGANVTSTRRASGLLGYAMIYSIDTIQISGCSNSGSITCLGPSNDYDEDSLSGGRYGAAAIMFIATDSENITTAPDSSKFTNSGSCTLIVNNSTKDTTIYYYFSHYVSE